MFSTAELRVLLWYHDQSRDYKNPAQELQEATTNLLGNGYLEVALENPDCIYQISAKGLALVRLLLRTEEPRKVVRFVDAKGVEIP